MIKLYRMKTFALHLTFFICICVTGCEVQSGITKKSVENYSPTPAPEKTVGVVEEPIDPADIIQADVSTQGPQIFISESTDKNNIDCSKYNRVMINRSGQEIKIKGVCSQLMINGDNNQVVAVAFSEIVLNGSANIVEYSKYANGKKPVVTDNTKENTVVKSAPAKSSHRGLPRFRNGPAFLKIVDNQNKLIRVVAVNDLDIYAGVGHSASDHS